MIVITVNILGVLLNSVHVIFRASDHSALSGTALSFLPREPDSVCVSEFFGKHTILDV